MKRYLLSIICLMVCVFAFSQGRHGHISESTSITSAKVYFTENMRDLDPIEGIYDVAVTQKSRNPLGRVFNNDSSSPFFVYKISDGQYGTSLRDHSIQRIGNTNAYSLTIKWGIGIRRYRFYLEDGSHFAISYEVPVEEVKRGMGAAYRPGFQTFVLFDGIKTYPLDKKTTTSEQTSLPATESDIFTGTGFALKDGYIVTNFHVIEGMRSIIVYGIHGDFSRGYSASVVASDKKNDLAIVRVSDSRFSGFGSLPYSISYSVADVGEEIWVLGYPLTQVLGNEIKLTNGVVSSRSGYQGDVATYQISAPVQPGSSGGPLFDSYGNIIGVVNAGVPGADNVGYAIKAAYLKNLVDRFSLSSVLPKANTISSLALKDQVKRVKDYVFLLICSAGPLENTASSVSPHPSSIVSTDISMNTTDSHDRSLLRPMTSEGEKAKAVDLGLSIKWADRNIGASSPSENGYFYAWGEILPKKEYSWENYKFRESGFSTDSIVFNKYNTSIKCGQVDNKKCLDYTDDAACSNWGGAWRMPTEKEIEELRENCTWTRTTLGGRKGHMVTSKINGNSIFFPDTGCIRGTRHDTDSNGFFWSSSLCISTPQYATYLYLQNGLMYPMVLNRFEGHTIRPVYAE